MPQFAVSAVTPITDYQPWVSGPRPGSLIGEVVALPTGGFLSLFSTSGGVYGRFHDASGQARDLSGITVASSVGNVTIDAVVEASGSILVTTRGGDVQAFRISSDGGTVTALGVIADDNPFSSDVLTFSKVTTLNDGGFALFWGTNSPVYTLSFYDANGLLRTQATPDFSGAMDPVETFTAVRDGSITTLADGTMIGAFQIQGTEFADVSSSTFRDIVVQRYNPDGTAQGTATRLTNDSITESDPEIIALSDGGYVVGWRTAANRLEYQVFNANGSERSAVLELSNTSDFSSDYVAGVLALEDGRFMITFRDFDSTRGSASDNVFYAQIFNADGTVAGEPTEYFTYGTSARDLSAAQLSDGKIVYAVDGGRGFELLRVNTLAEGQPTITGTLTEGGSVGVGNISFAGVTDADGLGSFADATARFFIADADGNPTTRVSESSLGSTTAGQRLVAEVTFTDADGNSETLLTAPSSVVGNVNNAPNDFTLRAPYQEDRVITVNLPFDQDNHLYGNRVDVDVPGYNSGLTYQWLQGTTEIAGATGATFTPTQAQVGETLSVRVSYVDAFGTRETITSIPSNAVVNVDDPVVGELTPTGFTGQPAQYDTVGVDLSGVSDEDGIASVRYQFFYRSGGFDRTLQSGSETTYTIEDQFVVGKILQVRLTFTDDFNNTSTRTLTLGTVENVDDPLTGTVAIAGTVAEDGQLSITRSGLSDLDGLSGSRPVYQWFRDGEAVEGATGLTFDLTQEDVGSVMTASVSYRDQLGNTGTLVTDPTAPVANVNDPLTGAITVLGSMVEDEELTVDTSQLADADGLGTFEYQWTRNGTDIEGATAATYTLGQRDVGGTMGLRVSFTDGQGTDESVSDQQFFNPVQNVNDPTTGVPLIVGTALENEQLRADVSGIADEDGTSQLNYQWFADGVAIGGATLSEFRLREGQISSRITVEVTHIDEFFNSQRLESAATDPVLAFPRLLEGTEFGDVLEGNTNNDTINAQAGDDVLRGFDGNDLLNAGDGTDTVNAGDGNDTINGGTTTEDRRDVIFGGAGDDLIDAGFGNDLVYGQDGNDTIAGGFGADELFGQAGDDVITGSAFSDLVFGGEGDDFVNGGFGFDRINGGEGADKFYHVGVIGHGSDWIQDYNAAEGDVLLYGGSPSVGADDFQLNYTHTASRTTGIRSGDPDVEEAFVIFRPTGQILWALVDGAGQPEINLQIGSDVFDLMV